MQGWERERPGLTTNSHFCSVIVNVSFRRGVCECIWCVCLVCEYVSLSVIRWEGCGETPCVFWRKTDSRERGGGFCACPTRTCILLLRFSHPSHCISYSPLPCYKIAKNTRKTKVLARTVLEMEACTACIFGVIPAERISNEDA